MRWACPPMPAFTSKPLARSSCWSSAELLVSWKPSSGVSQICRETAPKRSACAATRVRNGVGRGKAAACQEKNENWSHGLIIAAIPVGYRCLPICPFIAEWMRRLTPRFMGRGKFEPPSLASRASAGDRVEKPPPNAGTPFPAPRAGRLPIGRRLATKCRLLCGAKSRVGGLCTGTSWSLTLPGKRIAASPDGSLVSRSMTALWKLAWLATCPTKIGLQTVCPTVFHQISRADGPAQQAWRPIAHCCRRVTGASAVLPSV